MEVFVAVILYCTAGVCAPETTQAVSSGVLFKSEEDCVGSIVTEGIPYVEGNGGKVTQADCIPFTVATGS